MWCFLITLGYPWGHPTPSVLYGFALMTVLGRCCNSLAIRTAVIAVAHPGVILPLDLNLSITVTVTAGEGVVFIQLAPMRTLILGKVLKLTPHFGAVLRGISEF